LREVLLGWRGGKENLLHHGPEKREGPSVEKKFYRLRETIAEGGGRGRESSMARNFTPGIGENDNP